MELDETGERPGPPFARDVFPADWGDGGLTNEFVYETVRGRVVQHETFVARKGQPKTPQASRIVRPVSVRGHVVTTQKG